MNLLVTQLEIKDLKPENINESVYDMHIRPGHQLAPVIKKIIEDKAQEDFIVLKEELANNPELVKTERVMKYVERGHMPQFTEQLIIM